MANYVAMTRSNYFQVKDRGAFEGFCELFELEVIKSGEQLGFIVDSGEGSIPTMLCDVETGEGIDIDFMGLLAEHLTDGQVAVVMEIGYEKMRYLTGRALAVNFQGQQQMVDLAEIYQQAQELGQVTLAEY